MDKSDLVSRVAFFEKFAHMISAGISICDTLELMEKEAQVKDYKQMTGRVRDRVAAGKKFSESLALDLMTFKESTIRMLRAGEDSGQLDLTAHRVVKCLERELMQ